MGLVRWERGTLIWRIRQEASEEVNEVGSEGCGPPEAVEGGKVCGQA